MSAIGRKQLYAVPRVDVPVLARKRSFNISANKLKFAKIVCEGK